MDIENVILTLWATAVSRHRSGIRGQGNQFTKYNFQVDWALEHLFSEDMHSQVQIIDVGFLPDNEYQSLTAQTVDQVAFIKKHAIL